MLVDHAEDNLFEILRELEEERHVRTAVPVLADCKEEERMREVLTEHRPAVVFHAAAYKHVTMMELNPVEAIRNNALATRLVARIAGEVGVGAFVLVSTDKAVKPATVMGASKALAEWAVEAAAVRYPKTRYSTVRFGNVLGSSGSVVQIFRRQIAAGGPVTVTDPRMTRYFMTIPEAVQLVIRAGSLTERSGEVYVLEMGDSVKIIELAETMIRLSGLEPERDIAIEIVGARPGEKFHEDLFNPYERPQPTPVQRILRAQRAPLDPAVGGADLRRHQSAGPGGRCGGARRTRLQAVGYPSGGRRIWRPDRSVDCAPMANLPLRLICPPLHRLGGRRRRFCRDHRTGDPRAAVFRAGSRDRQPARAGLRGRPARAAARGAFDRPGPPAGAAAAQAVPAARAGAVRAPAPGSGARVRGCRGDGPRAASRRCGAGAERGHQG